MAISAVVASDAASSRARVAGRPAAAHAAAAGIASVGSERHEEPRGGSESSPPHREMRDGQQVRDDHEPELRRQPLELRVDPRHRGQTGDRRHEHRRVHEQTVELIEEQTRKSAGDVRRRAQSLPRYGIAGSGTP